MRDLLAGVFGGVQTPCSTTGTRPVVAPKVLSVNANTKTRRHQDTKGFPLVTLCRRVLVLFLTRSEGLPWDRHGRRGAAGIGRRRGNRQEKKGHGTENQGIGGAHAVQKAADPSSQGSRSREIDRHSRRDERNCFAEHRPQHGAWPCPQRHAHPDLPCAPRDRK